MDCEAQTVDERIQVWASRNQDMIAPLEADGSRLHNSDIKEFSMYGVALRELMDLAQATLHKDLDDH
ncbi:MAG: hypothetical protein R3F38_16905 [Gammaproteobacteria bacterium]